MFIKTMLLTSDSNGNTIRVIDSHGIPYKFASIKEAENNILELGYKFAYSDTSVLYGSVMLFTKHVKGKM